MAFKQNLSHAKPILEHESFMHLENVLSNEFIHHLEECGKQIKNGSLAEVSDWHIPGKKRQYLFDFPSRQFLHAFCQGIAQITGYDPEKITIGERHVKVYLEQAPDYPAPHMDRQAAEFTIGFPIEISEGSRVCFFPHMSRTENTDQRAIFAQLPPATDMEAFYADDRIAKFKGKVGDMFIFHGSTIFHERIKPSGSIILYIKINASGQDPLGEHASLLKSLDARHRHPTAA